MRPSQVAATVDLYIARRRPAMIWGAPGVGKSAILAQRAAAHSMELRDVRLNLSDPTDIKGFPVPNMETGQMNWLPADWLPPMYIEKTVTNGKGRSAKTTVQRVPNDTKGIIFLDEINQAPPSVQAAAYQLLLDRRIGSYVLPHGWVMFAAGNRETDRANAQRMPSGLSLRLGHIDLEANLEDWVAWALKEGTERVPTGLISFLRFRKDLLAKFDPHARSSPNPRSWTFVGEMSNSTLPADVELEMFSGLVGSGPAGEYVAHLRIERDLPTIDQVLANPKTLALPTSPAITYALITCLAAYTTKKTFPTIMTFINRMPPEWRFVYISDVQVRCPEICETAEYMEFSINNASYVC